MKTLSTLHAPRSIVSACLAGCLLAAGCAGFKPQPADYQSLAELAAYDGATLWLKAHPGDRGYFDAAQQLLTSLIADAKWDPVAFQQALATLPIKELKTDTGSIIVGSAVALYTMALREAQPIDQPALVKAFEIGVRNGLQWALSGTPRAAIRAPKKSGP
jgi:hypothetical protein